MLAPELAVAVAVTVVAVPTVVVELLAGAVMATVGAGAVTITRTADDVEVRLAESVTWAVRSKVPAVPGVHETLKGAVVTAAPIATELAKNATWETVAPALAVAVAETVCATPVVPVELFAGPLIVTVGPAIAVMAMALDVPVAPVESVTRAVRLKLPADGGVHVIE
jgi:hypothetical protein